MVYKYQTIYNKIVDQKNKKKVYYGQVFKEDKKKKINMCQWI